MVGRAAGPYFTAYTASKFAVCGFTESLRQELRGTDIHACLILPASIDTPFFQHAGNYYDRAVKALTPVYTAEQVAAAIVSCAERPRREVMIGQAAPMLILLRTLAPALFERTMARQVEVDHFQEAPAVPGSGNLFAPQPPMGVISGGWKGREDTSLRHVTTAMVAALVPASLVWLWLHSRGSGARAS